MNNIIKNIKLITGLLLLSTSFVACEKDNYEPPTRRLTGRVTYNDAAVGVQGGKEKNQAAQHSMVQLQLWQLNMPIQEAMVVNIAQDGSFTALLFDGDYRLVSKDGNGPWESRQDTVYFSVKGKDIKIDYPVVPYYTISDESFKLTSEIVSDSVTNYKLHASFVINQISETSEIESINLLVDNTFFVDYTDALQKVVLSGTKKGQNEVTTDISKAMREAKGLHARIAVKVKGVSDPVFSTIVFKIK